MNHIYGASGSETTGKICDELEVPEEIKTLIGNESFSVDDVGMSEGVVVLFSDKVLKIQSICEESENEHRVMEWLQDKLPVPRVLGFERQEEKNFLVMSKLPGKMSCSNEYMRNPERLTSILAEGLQMLWKVDISNCPFSSILEKKLQMAKYSVDNNMVDMDNVEEDTFGENGFKNAEQLLEWLTTNKPEEELVFSHGDFCLPNIFIEEGKLSGYIDLGKTGIADKWQDIALCYRSLLHKFDDKYTGKTYEGYTADMLFKELGLEPNWDKIRYYILLDELF